MPAPLPILLAVAALAQEPPDDTGISIDIPLRTPSAGPSPARLCADAASGTEVEVCMRLAAAHPNQTNQIAAALRAHIDRYAAPDRQLLTALLMLLSEDTGVDGARRLGELGDPRAVGPLAHAGETRGSRVAIESTYALARYREGLQPLSRWLTDPDMPLEVRIAAAEALGDLGVDEGADAMLTTLRRPGVPPALRSAMLSSIEHHFPSRLAELEHQVSTDGAPWLSAGGAWGLGYTMALAGYFGRSRLAGLGAVSGSIAGGTGGWLAGRAWPMEASDAAFITTNGVTGTVGGVLVGSALDVDDRAAAGWLGGFAGEVVGYGLGLGLRDVHPGSVQDSVEATAVAGATAVAAGTAADFFDRRSRMGWEDGHGVDAPRLAAGIGLLAGQAAGQTLAPRVHLGDNDGWLIGLSSAYGLAFGSLVPLEADRRALPATGLALGALTGYALSTPVEAGRATLFAGATGGALGGVFGTGVGLLIDPMSETDGDVVRGAALAGSTAGLGVGAWLAARDPDTIDTPDVVLVGGITAWTTWQAVGWYNHLFPPPRYDGLFLMVPAGASMAFAAASPHLDVPVAYSFSALSVGVWGGYLGGVAAELGQRDVLLWSLLGSNAGLAAGIGLAAPPISAPPLVIGLADAGGVLGGSLAALGTSFFTTDVDAVLTASLVGAGAGFGTGAVLGSSLHRSGATNDVARLPRLPGRWSLTPAALPGRESVAYGARIEVREW